MYDTCGGQRTSYSSQLSPFILWVLGIERRSSGLAGSTFIHPGVVMAFLGIF